MIACAGSLLTSVIFVPLIFALVVIAWDFGDITPELFGRPMSFRKLAESGSRVQLCNSVCRDWFEVPNLFHWCVFAFGK